LFKRQVLFSACTRRDHLTVCNTYFSGWDILRLARIAEKGHVGDVDFSNEIINDEVHAINSDSDDEISQMERMIPTEDTVHDGLPNAPTDHWFVGKNK
jgi:hypothetical protein